MRVIYATGQPRDLDFAVTDSREAVPSGAILFAICTAERTIENLDEDLFNAITDEEYYAFRALVNEAEQLEKLRQPMRRSAIELYFEQFFRWLMGRQEMKRASNSQERRIA
jgi:hypothetical protein